MRCIWRRTVVQGLFFLLGLGQQVWACAGEAPVLQICVGDEESYPWHFPDRPGVLIHMMRMVESRVGGKFVIEAKPWRRCLLEAKSGLVQAVFKSSYSEERAAEGAVFPMRGGQLDTSKRMLTESYSLFRLKGARVEWDGKQLSADGILGAQTGFSVVAQLKGLGAKVDDGNRQTGANFQKLLKGRVVAVAVQTQVGEAQLAQNPEWAARVERMQPVLVEKPYFLIFSRGFFAEQEDHARLIWAAIEQVRESSEYKELLLNFK
ncbi:substrate-binding periplasmic protein [Roseateles oligotrophus]|uniref:Transporter substrate-binding domain-containing protein n=1 Tax=Roseateles oligotrophus TaxID=1769250 RepID=A0ABT2Y8C3_9BURK|nr:transporter substrate-binding domain-containing protein [Roseateles oligotrophus]MCV2366538.1 transporter substrate-binding domain-containing protein [Roseateles oligotrophus]